MWTDSHVHLTDQAFEEDLPEVLGRAAKAGVTRMAVIGCEKAHFGPALDLAEGTRGLVAVLGFHPAEAGKVGCEDLRELEALCSRPSVRAVGEIGLDYHWEPGKKDLQRALLERQIAMANALGKPIVVHEREAFEDAFALLGKAEVPVLLHCFSHGREEARRALDRGWSLALGGMVTFRSADQTRDVGRFVPGDRLMVETDAPYLSPHPHRGRRNEPARLAVTGAFVAELRGATPEKTAEETTRNAENFFGTWEPLEAEGR